MKIDNIINSLTKVFKSVKKPLEPLPPQLLFMGAKLRSGLSAEEIATDIIARQAEAGAPFGQVFSDYNNISEAMEVIRVQTIIEHLLLNAKIEVVIPPGIPVITMGANAAGAVISNGSTTNMASGEGVIR